MAERVYGPPETGPELDVRPVVDAIPAVAWSSRPDGAVEFVNRRWRDYTGLSSEESYGSGWKAAVHPEDIADLLEMWGEVRALDKSMECKVRLRGSDGLFRWFLLRREPLYDEGGSVVRWYGIGIDIEGGKQTELLRVPEKRTLDETQLRRVIDAIPGLVWCNFADGPNEFLNKRWHDYTGLSHEESQGWGWQVAFHPEDLPPLMEKWQELLVSGEPGEIEARLRRHDGVYRWFLIRVQPFRDESG